MTKTILQTLKDARAILENHWRAWSTHDHAGNYCSMGALGVAATGKPCGEESIPKDLTEKLNQAALRLHPECDGLIVERLPFFRYLFDENPMIYVNNALGKAATLKVFDEAIAQEELAEINREFAGKPPDPDPTPTPEPEPVQV